MQFGSDFDGESSKVFQISSSLLTKPAQMITEIFSIIHVDVPKHKHLHNKIVMGMLLHLAPLIPIIFYSPAMLLYNSFGMLDLFQHSTYQNNPSSFVSC